MDVLWPFKSDDSSVVTQGTMRYVETPGKIGTMLGRKRRRIETNAPAFALKIDDVTEPLRHLTCDQVLAHQTLSGLMGCREYGNDKLAVGILGHVYGTLDLTGVGGLAGSDTSTCAAVLPLLTKPSHTPREIHYLAQYISVVIDL